MMIALFLLCFCVSVWGGTPALIEAKQRYPKKSTLEIRFVTDDYVWSGTASQSIRRKYIISHMSMAVAFLALAQIVRTYEMNSDRRVVGIVIGNLLAIFAALSTMRKVYKHGF